MSSLTRIRTNTQALRSYSRLQRTNSELALRRQRLSTGKRINSAEDDSAGYFIAKRLESKVRGQAQALANIGDAKSLLTVAEGGLTTSMDILQSMKEKVVQAASDTMGEAERNAIESQIRALTAEISDIVQNTDFNGNQLLNGTGGAAGDGGFTFQVSADAGDTFDVQLGSVSTDELGITEEFDNFYGGDMRVDTDSAEISEEAAPASADLYAGEEPREFSVSVQSISGDDVTFELLDGRGNAVKDTTGTAITVTSNLPDGGSGFSLANFDGITSLEDPGAGGTSVGTLVVSLDNAKVAASDLSVGDSLTVHMTDSTLELEDAEAAAQSLDILESAIDTVSKELAGIGDAQKRLSFKEQNLSTARNNYASARSRIIDADFAREQLQITKLQILQQAGQASLTQANAAPQSVLQLLGG